MKKILCILLSVCMLFGCLGVFSFAEEKPYTKAWTINIDEDSSARANIALVKNFGTKESPKFEIQENEDGTCSFYADNTPVLTPPETSYIIDGDSVYFVVIPNGSYASDQSTVYKALPEDYKMEIITDENMEMPGVTLNPIQTVSTEVYADKVIVGNRLPTSEDEITYTVSVKVYCVNNVSENMVVRVYNLQTESVSGVKDFLINFYRFFLQILQWFFGLDFDLP